MESMLITDEVKSVWVCSGRMFISDYYKEAGCPLDIMTIAKFIAAGKIVQ